MVKAAYWLGMSYMPGLEGADRASAAAPRPVPVPLTMEQIEEIAIGRRGDYN